MILGGISGLTLSLIGSFLISAVLWLILWVMFGRRVHPAIAIVIITVVVFMIGLIFDLTTGISLVFSLALTALFNSQAVTISLFGLSSILAAAGIIAISISVVAVIIADAVERATSGK